MKLCSLSLFHREGLLESANTGIQMMMALLVPLC